MKIVRRIAVMVQVSFQKDKKNCKCQQKRKRYPKIAVELKEFYQLTNILPSKMMCIDSNI